MDGFTDIQKKKSTAGSTTLTTGIEFSTGYWNILSMTSHFLIGDLAYWH